MFEEHVNQDGKVALGELERVCAERGIRVIDNLDLPLYYVVYKPEGGIILVDKNATRKHFIDMLIKENLLTELSLVV